MTDKTIAKCLILILLIAVFDSISTYILSLQPGFSELNPIMELAFASKNPFVFFVIRLAPTALFAFCIWQWHIPGKRIIPFGITLLIAAHTTLIIWHFIIWFDFFAKT